LSTLNRLVIFGVFLPIIGCCLYGAIAGYLYTPSRRGPVAAHFSGIHAWAFVASFTLMLVAVFVREREIGFMSDRARKVFELVLLTISGRRRALSIERTSLGLRLLAAAQLKRLASRAPTFAVDVR
jgi:hypothetical protein